MINHMKRVLFIGQAPPQKIQDRPFGRTRLYKWFSEAGISEAEQENFFFGALVDFFPGKSKSGSGDRAPNPAEIITGQKQLQTLIKKVKPDIIVPIGILSARVALGDFTVTLDTVIGKKFTVNAYGLCSRPLTVIPLPHPSGASRWIWQANHQALVAKALAHLVMALR